MEEAPSFWAFSVPPGGTLSQQVPRGASVCLTSAVLSEKCASRVSLTATSSGISAVLCNLFGTSGHELARLGQPFRDDFELSVSKGGSAIHISGYARGDLGPVEVLGSNGSAVKSATTTAVTTSKPKKELKALPAPTGTSGGDERANGAKASTIAQRSRAVTADDVMGAADDDDDDEEEEEEEGEEEEGEEEEGEEEDDYEDDDDDEEEGEEEDDEEEDDDDEEEDDDESDMPLAPQSVAAILKGKGAASAAAKRAAPTAAATEPPAKAAKKTEAPAAAKSAAAKPAAEPAAAPPFIASKTFAGAKAGYVFKKGAQGVGYYKDTPPAARPAKQPTTAQRAAGGAQETKQPTWNRMPSGVEMQELKTGVGGVANWGRKVRVKYRGTLTNGKQFDAGSISFKLGGGEVIPGWDHGIKGMRQGGQRKLRIPPHLAYGKRGAPPQIPGNATLLFDVELLQC